jgi:hypothetical protein
VAHVVILHLHWSTFCLRACSCVYLNFCFLQGPTTILCESLITRYSGATTSPALVAASIRGCSEACGGYLLAWRQKWWQMSFRPSRAPLLWMNSLPRNAAGKSSSFPFESKNTTICSRFSSPSEEDWGWGECTIVPIEASYAHSNTRSCIWSTTVRF